MIDLDAGPCIVKKEFPAAVSERNILLLHQTENCIRAISLWAMKALSSAISGMDWE